MRQIVRSTHAGMEVPLPQSPIAAELVPQ